MVTAHVGREPLLTLVSERRCLPKRGVDCRVRRSSVSRPPRSLFEEYKCTRDPKLRTRLVEGHLNIAYAAARRFLSSE